MIRYALKCPSDHAFESWFQSSAAYDALHRSGHVTCPACGSPQVEKALMAPSVRTEEPARTLSQPVSEMEQKLAELRRQVEENSEYVGLGFAAEARAIHAGDAPERAIYGEAKADEARALIEDGVPVTPLPFLPQRKAN